MTFASRWPMTIAQSKAFLEASQAMSRGLDYGSRLSGGVCLKGAWYVAMATLMSCSTNNSFSQDTWITMVYSLADGSQDFELHRSLASRIMTGVEKHIGQSSNTSLRSHWHNFSKAVATGEARYINEGGTDENIVLVLLPGSPGSPAANEDESNGSGHDVLDEDEFRKSVESKICDSVRDQQPHVAPAKDDSSKKSSKERKAEDYAAFDASKSEHWPVPVRFIIVLLFCSLCQMCF